MNDWVGNDKTAYSIIGASNHSNTERQVDDYYATNPVTIDSLLKFESFSNKIWECACGEGHLSKKLIDCGFEVKSTDLIDRHYGQGNVNFLEEFDSFDGDIITNPPYKYAMEFVNHSLDLITDGHKVAMFLKLTFLEGQKRYKELFSKGQLKAVYVFVNRQVCAKNGDFANAEGSAIAYAWFVWEKGYTGKTIVDWIV